MQGRLSSLVDGRIQAFPHDEWASEFRIAEAIGIGLLEWTLDSDRLDENPLMSVSGRAMIKDLCGLHGVSVPSLTGDCFMQAPFWKADGGLRRELQHQLMDVLEAARALGVAIVVIPLVDDGRIGSREEEEILVGFLSEQASDLLGPDLMIVFESDLPPGPLAAFIERFDVDTFGLNYDIGNSASLGFDPEQEFFAYGDRVANVHVKDRSLGGTTVPLGDGDADFDMVFGSLAAVGYSGNYILQTARDVAGDHRSAIARYRDMTEDWITRHGS